jgi:pyruvate,water dikinase
MVDAAVSGVAFTASPRTGDPSVVAINASWGLGQAIVSGEVTPDEYWVSKVDLRVTGRTVTRKLHECRPDPAGHGVHTVDVPPERQERPSLDDNSVRAVAAMAVVVERHYGCPQDIEWTLDRAGRLLVLQSRPETRWKARRAATGPRPTDYLAVVHAAAASVAGRSGLSGGQARQSGTAPHRP